MKLIKALFKPVFQLSGLLLLLTVTQVKAATISYLLEQSNDLLDGISYAQVTISDSTTIAGDIDFSVEVLSSTFTVSGSNFGMQSFSFNYDPVLSVDESNITDIGPFAWTVSDGTNAGGGFGKFGFQLSGNGSTRTELLNFSITGIDDDSIYSYSMGSAFKPAATEFFAAHIAGFDEINGVTSAKFAGSIPGIPVPAAIYLFASGLLALVVAARRRF